MICSKKFLALTTSSAVCGSFAGVIGIFPVFPPLPSGEGRGEGVLEYECVLILECTLTLTLSRRERGPETQDTTGSATPAPASSRDISNMISFGTSNTSL